MRILALFLLALVLTGLSTTLMAQDAEGKPTVFAIFPFKNLYGEVQYNDLGWEYADSIEAWMNRQEGAGKLYEIVPGIDVRDQMLAGNVDVTSPSYETDVWTIAEALGASKILWGEYYVKYNKVFLEINIIDLTINMADTENIGESKGLLYEKAIESVPTVGAQLYPGMK